MGLRAIQMHRNYLESAIGLHKIREYEDNGNIELENFTFSYGKYTLDLRSMECTAEPVKDLGKNITVLIVTHDMELINRCCTHILHI